MKSIDVDRAIGVLNRQTTLIEREQAEVDREWDDRGDMTTSKLTSQVMTMARGLAAILAELRKTAEDAESQASQLTPDRIAELTCKLVTKLSPEHRAAVGLLIRELDGKLITHG